MTNPALEVDEPSGYEPATLIATASPNEPALVLVVSCSTDGAHTL